MLSMQDKSIQLKLDTFKVTREGHLDARYEAKRLTMNTLRIVGFVAYTGVLKLDKAVEASKKT